MNKTEYYVSVFALFLQNEPDWYVINRYVENIDNIDYDFLSFQDYISVNKKDSLDWMTAISIIEAADTIVDGAISNGNILKVNHTNFIQ